MYLAPDGDEIEIANAAAEFLAEALAIDRLHGTDAADLQAPLRQLLGELGWFALAVPEALGGSGLSPVEHVLFFREAGRQCAPVDLLAQCLAANAISDASLRKSVIAGDTGVALMVKDGEHYRIFGAADAEYALLVSPDDARLYAMAGIATTPRPALDPANSIRLAQDLPDPIETASSGAAWQLGQLGTAAMLVGIAEAALDLIVEYAKIRETFGRK